MSLSKDHRILFEAAIGQMNSDNVKLNDLLIFNNELRDTIVNYYLYASNTVLFYEKESEIMSLCTQYKISSESLNYLNENVLKIKTWLAGKSDYEKLKEDDSDTYELFQKILLVFLGRDFDLAEVMRMRAFFGIRRNLKKKNKAIMIPNLYKILVNLGLDN